MAGGLATADTTLSLASTAYNAAKWLWTTANGIRKAPEIWKSIEKDLNITKTKIQLLIKTVDKITEDSVPNSSYIVALNSLKGKLEADLEKIKSRPQKEEPTNKRHRVSFAVTDEGNLREFLGQLETHAGDLLAWLLLYYLSDRLRWGTVQVEKLDEKVLTCYGEKTQILNAPWLHTSNAEYRPDGTKPKKEVVVLLDNVDEKAIKTVAGLLRRWIGGTDGDFAAGILPCPGFQDNKLLFILPSNADIPQTLQTTIAEDMANGRVASLGQRFDLARQLADAVFMLPRPISCTRTCMAAPPSFSCPRRGKWRRQRKKNTTASHLNVTTAAESPKRNPRARSPKKARRRVPTMVTMAFSAN